MTHIFIYILNPQTIISMFRCHPYRFYTWSQTAGSSWIMHFILSAYNDTTVILVCWHTTPIHFHIRKLERRALHQVWRWFCYSSHFGLGRRWGGKIIIHVVVVVVVCAAEWLIFPWVLTSLEFISESFTLNSTKAAEKRLMKFVKLEFLPAAKWKFLWCHTTQRRCISFSNHQSTLLPHCQQPPA